MTGWRIGYAVGPPELARAMTHLNEFVVSNAPGVIQEAARVALRDGEAFIAESVKRYAHHQRLVIERLTGIEGVRIAEAGRRVYVFPRLRGLADSFGFCERLVTERGVGFAPGAAFGTGGEGHIRICFAVDEATLIEALDRFEGRLGRISSRGGPIVSEPRRRILFRGRKIDLALQEVTLADGSIAEREVVLHRGAVALLADRR